MSLESKLWSIETVTDGVVDVLEFRITLFVGRSGPLAVSGSVDPLADPAPDASGSSE